MTELEYLDILKVKNYIESSEDFDILNSAQWVDTSGFLLTYNTPPEDYLKLTEEDEIKGYTSASFPVSYIEGGKINIVQRLLDVLCSSLGVHIEKEILGRISFVDIKEEDIKKTRFFMNNTIMAPSETMNNMMDTYKIFSGPFSTFVRPCISYLLEDNQFITIEKEAPLYIVMQDMVWAERERDQVVVRGSFDIRVRVDGYKGYNINRN